MENLLGDVSSFFEPNPRAIHGILIHVNESYQLDQKIEKLIKIELDEDEDSKVEHLKDKSECLRASIDKCKIKQTEKKALFKKWKIKQKKQKALLEKGKIEQRKKEILLAGLKARLDTARADVRSTTKYVKLVMATLTQKSSFCFEDKEKKVGETLSTCDADVDDISVLAHALEFATADQLPAIRAKIIRSLCSEGPRKYHFLDSVFDVFPFLLSKIVAKQSTCFGEARQLLHTGARQQLLHKLLSACGITDFDEARVQQLLEAYFGLQLQTRNFPKVNSQDLPDKVKLQLKVDFIDLSKEWTSNVCRSQHLSWRIVVTENQSDMIDISIQCSNDYDILINDWNCSATIHLTIVRCADSKSLNFKRNHMFSVDNSNYCFKRNANLLDTSIIVSASVITMPVTSSLRDEYENNRNISMTCVHCPQCFNVVEGYDIVEKKYLCNNKCFTKSARRAKQRAYFDILRKDEEKFSPSFSKRLCLHDNVDDNYGCDSDSDTSDSDSDEWNWQQSPTDTS